MDIFTRNTLAIAVSVTVAGVLADQRIDLWRDLDRFELVTIDIEVEWRPEIDDDYYPDFDLREVPTESLYTDYDREQIHCLALNAYFEARGSSIDDQIAVNYVVLNRVEHDNWASTPCDVIYQPYQFSWTHDGISDIPREQEAWVLAQIVAEQVYSGSAYDATDGSTHYHATYVQPYWANYAVDRRQIGAHHYMTLTR